MNSFPVLGEPLHWHPALLVLTAIAVTPGVHLLASPLLEARKVTWHNDYAAVLIGDPLLALAAGLGASMSQPSGPHGWPASWAAGCAWLAGGWTFGLWQSRHELAAGHYTRGQILSPTKLWHQFAVYPLLGYWVTAAEWSGLAGPDTPAHRLQATLVIACTATWAALAWNAIRHPKTGHGTLDRTRLHKVCSRVASMCSSRQQEEHTHAQECCCRECS
jgi:hypothetical protein